MALDDKDIFAAIFAKYSNQPTEYVIECAVKPRPSGLGI